MIEEEPWLKEALRFPSEIPPEAIKAINEDELLLILGEGKGRYSLSEIKEMIKMEETERLKKAIREEGEKMNLGLNEDDVSREVHKRDYQAMIELAAAAGVPALNSLVEKNVVGHSKDEDRKEYYYIKTSA